MNVNVAVVAELLQDPIERDQSVPATIRDALLVQIRRCEGRRRRALHWCRAQGPDVGRQYHREIKV